MASVNIIIRKNNFVMHGVEPSVMQPVVIRFLGLWSYNF